MSLVFRHRGASFPVVPPGGIPDLVQLHEKAQTGSQVTEFQINISGVTQGNLLVLLLACSTADITWEVDDGFVEDQYCTNWDVAMSILSLPNAGAGAHTITVVPSALEFVRYAIMEFENIAASSHVIDKATGGGLTDIVNGGSVTTALSNTLVFGAVRTDGDETAHGNIYVSSGDGFALVYPFANSEPEQKLLCEYTVVGAGTYPSNDLFTMDSADGGGYTAGIVAYKAA